VLVRVYVRACRVQHTRETKQVIASHVSEVEAEIKAWEQEMATRQAKQDAAIAAVHRTLATRLTEVRASSEAEARDAQRADAGMRKVLTAALEAMPGCCCCRG
jgi:Lhr-like helicase